MSACSNCGGDWFAVDGGETICTHCGVVQSEERVLQEVAPNNRAPPPTVAFNGYGKGTDTFDGLGRRMDRLSARDVTLRRIAGKAEKLCEVLNLPSYTRIASQRAVVELKEKGGKVRANNDIAVLAVYAGCRECGFPLQIKKLSAACPVALGWLDGRMYTPGKIFRLVYDARLQPKRLTPEDCLRPVLQKLQNDEEVRKKLGKRINRRIVELNEGASELLKTARLPGRDPWHLAAAALCVADESLAGKEGVGRKAMARAAGWERTSLSDIIILLRKAKEKKRAEVSQRVKLWPSGHSSDYSLVLQVISE